MSHHASGPKFGSPRGDARLDMTDLYAFPKPGDADKSILVLPRNRASVIMKSSRRRRRYRSAVSSDSAATQCTSGA
jgi:hypothetical protein